jgi:hypothetical protein
MAGAGNNQQNAAVAVAAVETAVVATVIVAAWRQRQQWLQWTTGGGGSGNGGSGIGCGVGCGVGGGFCSSGGGGSKHQDDGGMEEVVIWRLFMFDKPVGAAQKNSALPWRQYHILYPMVHIVVSTEQVVDSFTIKGGLLHRDSGITVAGFDVIAPQVLEILSTPCCSHIGYIGT